MVFFFFLASRFLPFFSFKFFELKSHGCDLVVDEVLIGEELEDVALVVREFAKKF